MGEEALPDIELGRGSVARYGVTDSRQQKVLVETACEALELGQDDVERILEEKQGIWNNEEMWGLITHYLDNNKHTLHFFKALEKCLRNAKRNQIIIQICLQHIPLEEAEYRKMLETFENVKNAGSPFVDHFFRHLESTYEKYIRTVKNLHATRKNLDEKLKHSNAWKKLCSVIFLVGFVAVVIWSLVGVAKAAPLAMAALAATLATTIAIMDQWVDSVWNKYIESIKEKREFINSMHLGTVVALKDLIDTKELVDRVDNLIILTVRSGEDEDKDAVQHAVQCCMDEIHRLSTHSDRCRQDIQKATKFLLYKILRDYI